MSTAEHTKSLVELKRALGCISEFSDVCKKRIRVAAKEVGRVLPVNGGYLCRLILYQGWAGIVL